MALRVGCGVLAALVAGAGDDAAGDGVRLGEESHALHRARERGHVGIGHVRDDQALPDREAQLALAVVVGEVGEAAHLLASCRPTGTPTPT